MDELAEWAARQGLLVVPVREHLYRVRIASPALEPRATVGSGDAFLAGYVAARYEGRAPSECLRFGVACGAESTSRLGAGLVDPREIDKLMGDVEVRELAEPAEVP